MSNALLLVQMVFGAALVWTCFCRALKTDSRTVREIRWAICFEGGAAGLVVGAPFLPALIPEFLGHGWLRWQPGETPLWVWVELLVAACLVQFVTAKFWRDGKPPPDFQREE